MLTRSSASPKGSMAAILGTDSERPSRRVKPSRQRGLVQERGQFVCVGRMSERLLVFRACTRLLRQSPRRWKIRRELDERWREA
jgi:hypothetical protein